MKIRFNIRKIEGDKALVVPMPDETLILIPEGVDSGRIMNVAFTVEIKTEDLRVEAPWDDVKHEQSRTRRV